MWAVTAGIWEDYAGWGQLWFVGVFSTEELAAVAVKEAESGDWEAWYNECQIDKITERDQ